MNVAAVQDVFEDGCGGAPIRDRKDSKRRGCGCRDHKDELRPHLNRHSAKGKVAVAADRLVQLWVQVALLWEAGAWRAVGNGGSGGQFGAQALHEECSEGTGGEAGPGGILCLRQEGHETDSRVDISVELGAEEEHRGREVSGQLQGSMPCDGRHH